MSLARPRGNASASRVYHQTVEPRIAEDDHQHILVAISELKSDKEALKAALKAAIAKRDELFQRASSCEEEMKVQVMKRKELEVENSQLRRDNQELARKAEDYRLEAENYSSVSSKVDQRAIKELVARNQKLEDEVQRLKAKHKNKHSRETNELVESALGSKRASDEILKYTQFIIEKLSELPEMLSLFKGRVASSRRFRDNVIDRRYEDCLLKSLQFTSDLLVYQTHQPTSEPVSPPNPPFKSQGIQTISEQGTNTSPSRNRLEKKKTPSFASIQAEEFPGKQNPTLDLPGFMMSTATSTMSGDGFLSPISIRSGVSGRGEEEYTKLMDESEHLLSTLHYQNDRLQRLNSQIHQTMHGNIQKPPLQYSESTPTLGSRPDSTSPNNSRRPNIGIPSSPQSLEPVPETHHRDETSSDKDPAEGVSEQESTFASPKSDISDGKRPRKVPGNGQRTHMLRKPQPRKLVMSKTDV